MTDEKPIRLRVVSVMTDPDGGRHESKTVHRGTLRAGEDGLEIAYEQVDEGVRARICLTRTADGVRMRRTGEMTGALHFQPGRKTAGLYGTAYGDIPVAVYTREVLTESLLERLYGVDAALLDTEHGPVVVPKGGGHV